MDGRKLNVVQIILWAALAVFLTGALIFGISEGGISWSREMSVQKQETIALDGIQNIRMDFSSENISITPVDDNQIKVVETCNKSLRESEKFTATSENGTLTISQGRGRFFIGIFGMNMNRKVELFIPRSYAGSLGLNLNSGNVVISDALTLKSFDSSLDSGNFEAGSLAVSEDAVITTDSGNVKIGGLTSKNYSLRVTSGNIRIDDLSGSGEIKGTSGNIRIDSLSISGIADVKTTSGNIEIVLPRDLSFEFEGYTASGNINTDFGIMYESDKKHASGKVGSGPYMKLSTEVTSGNINITRN